VERSERRISCAPIQNKNRDRTLLFSGQVFPDEGDQSDRRSYLIERAEKEPCFPCRLNGLFHGILTDQKNCKAILFNDRYGMHRLYYHEAPDAFYFAAEAKAILAVRSELRSVDTEGLAQFISCGCTLENRSIFSGVSVLPAGAAWVFQAGALTAKGNHFSPKEWEEQPALDPESYYQALKAAFAKAVPKYFAGPEPVGVALTGGLDSRMLMAWRGASSAALRCYSFGSAFRESQDVKIARRVAQASGQMHNVIQVDHDFLDRFPYYAEHTVLLTDGCVEVKHAPDLYVSKQSAQMASVRVTGNYGGEVLRRVHAFKPVAALNWIFTQDLNSRLDSVNRLYSRLLTSHPLSFAVFRQAPWYQHGLLSLERTQLDVRSPFLDNDIVRTAYQAPRFTLENNDVSLRLIADGSRELRAIRTDRGYGGSLPDWLAALQQAYFAFTFKAEYACDYGMPGNIVRLDRALKRLQPERAFLGRHKFTHFRLWYRDELSNYVREMLLDPRSLARPYLQRRSVECIVEEHCAGRKNHTIAIHKILTLEYIHRLFIDK
jgi:asparagine synthase (glutamine-hydrolysing)